MFYSTRNGSLGTHFSIEWSMFYSTRNGSLGTHFSIEWPMFYSTKIGSLGTSFSIVAYVLLYQKLFTWHSCLYSTNSGSSRNGSLGTPFSIEWPMFYSTCRNGSLGTHFYGGREGSTDAAGRRPGRHGPTRAARPGRFKAARPGPTLADPCRAALSFA